MSSLFRPEVQAAQSSQWLGSVRLSQPLGYSATALGGLSIAIALGLFGAFGTYTKKATVPGLLTPASGVLRVTSASGGTVAEMRVKEGDSVATGDVLFVVSSERTSELGDTQALIARELKRRAEIAGRDAQLSKVRADERIRSLTDRVSAIDTEISSFTRDAELHAERERIARDGVSRYEQLAKTGFVSSAQTDTQRETLLALQAQRQALLRNKNSLQRERATLTAQIDEARMTAKTEASDLAKSAALLTQEATENQARTRLVVTAPSPGTITGVNVQTGQTINAGALFATLLPHESTSTFSQANSPLPFKGRARVGMGLSSKPDQSQTAPLTQPLQVHLFATTRQAGFVEPNQRVRIRYAAYPYQKFGMGEGVVTEVSKSPYAVQELPPHVAATLNALTQAGDPVYRVTVTLNEQSVRADGKDHALKPGMLAEADIIQDTRRLWEWVLEPVFSMSGRVVAVHLPVRPEQREGFDCHELARYGRNPPKDQRRVVEG